MSDAPIEKVNLLGLTLPQLEAFFESIGEKKFRAAQVIKWIHQHGVLEFEQMSNLASPYARNWQPLLKCARPRSGFKVTRQTVHASG